MFQYNDQGKRMFKSFLVSISVAAVSFFSSGAASATSITYGGYNDTASVQQLRDAFKNPANASALGVSSVVEGGTVAFGNVTSAYLSGIDVFFTGANGIVSSPTPSDVSNLVNWVNGGGSLIINNDRSTSFTSLSPLLNAFGIGLVSLSTSAIEALNIVDDSHPIMDGAFGTVGSIGLRDASRFSSSNPDFKSLAEWQNGDIAIGVIEPDANAGRLGKVVVLPDVECFLLLNNECSGLGSGDYTIAGRNALAYAVAPNTSVIPLPAGLPLLLSGLGGLAWLRRRKKAANA